MFEPSVSAAGSLNRDLCGSLPIWAGFSYGVVPNVITAAYNERSLSVLNWLFQGHRSAPIEHYLDRWSVIATAVQIATILHLGIVLFIRSIDRKHRLLLLPRADLYTNIVLIAFAAAFLALTILSGVRGDYTAYLLEWKVVLAGHIPWRSRPIQRLWAFVQRAGPSSLDQPSREQAFVRVLLPRLCGLADQGFRAAPWSRCSLVALVGFLAPQPLPLGGNCVFRILRCSRCTRVRRRGPQPDWR